MNPSAQLDYQRETLRGLVANVEPQQLSAPTPCAEWDVRGLIGHFVGGAGMFAAAFRGEAPNIDPDAPMPDLLGDDPLGAFDAALGQFNAAIDQPGAMDRTITLPFGQMPAPMVLISREMRNGDTFAEEVTVRAQATPIEQLVAFTGRNV